MIDFPLGEEALRSIIENRTDYLTSFLQFFTFLGEDEGYILIITFIYMVYDKRLAIRLAIIVLATMAVNHLLKMLVGNPRPFVREGTFMEKWLISADYAKELATEFSTPSGHAMSSFTFYGYLCHVFRSVYFRIAAILIIFFIGISRPYLAVHFVEDIALGWMIGLVIILLTVKYADSVTNYWKRLSLIKQITFTIGCSLFVWIITFYIKGGSIADLPTPFIGHLGFILGVVSGTHLEERNLNFDPQSKDWGMKITRWLLTVPLVMAPLLLMEMIFETYWTESTYLSHLFLYACYTISGFLGIYIAPLIFIKLNLLNQVRN